MTSEINRAPLLCHCQLCASFCSRVWIQTGVTVWKRPNCDKICFDLCDLNLWPWPFVWTSLLLMVTRTTRTPAFWEYPPPPHDYPYYWFISDPKSKIYGKNVQGSHAFRMMKFLDFSRTFPGPNLIFQGPSRTKTTINTHKYSLPSNRFSLLLHKQGKQWFNGTYQEILMNNISEICVNNIQVSH